MNKEINTDGFTFKHAFTLLASYWRSEQKWSAIGLLAISLALSLGVVYINTRLNLISGNLYNALQKLDKQQFIKQIYLFSEFLFVFVFVITTGEYMRNFLSFRWRMWLTNKYLERWTRNNEFYYSLTKGGKTDNPDQRISEDLRIFPSLTVQLVVATISEIASLIAFSVILWNLSKVLTISLFSYTLHIPGYLIIVAFTYSLIGTGLVFLVGRRLIPLNFLNERYEANFRKSLILLQERRTEIALYDGSPFETKNLSEKFTHIKDNFYSILYKNIHVNLFQLFYINLDQLIPLIAGMPMFFAGAITLGNLMQISNAFGRVKSSFSILVTNFETLAQWTASTKRLMQLEDDILNADKDIKNTKIIINPMQANSIKISNLFLKKPDGDEIFSNFSQTIKLGEKVLIKGPSGVGKSTLTKAMKGLWLYGKGSISIPENKKWHFIPQKPYMPFASLSEAIFYPDITHNHDQIERAKELMKKFNLTHLIRHINSVQNWGQVLSLGEQQRVAIIRMIVHKPDIIVMDESTSSLNLDYARTVLKSVLEHNPKATILAVSHSDELDKFFDRKIVLSV